MKVTFGDLPKNILGICIKKNQKIVVDLTKDENILKVFLHEMLHARYPKQPEEVILIIENEVWSWLNQEDVYLLGRLLFGRRFKETHVEQTKPKV
jgi:hypothetical protein